VAVSANLVGLPESKRYIDDIGLHDERSDDQLESTTGLGECIFGGEPVKGWSGEGH